MNYLKLTEKDIRDHIDDPIIYHRGRMYFFNGFVESVRVDDTGRRIVAQVRGSNNYTVTFNINSYQNIVSEACTCMYYTEHKMPCKHIAAALFETRRMVEMEFTRYRNSHKAVNAIFLKLDQAGRGVYQGNKDRLLLEPVLTISQAEKGIQAYLELKVGLNRFYVVKSAEEFIEAWVKGVRLTFGKQLILDSNKQFFEGKDALIMSLLKDIYQSHTELLSYNNAFYYSGSSFLKGRYFLLMPSRLEKFLDIMAGGDITACLFSNKSDTIPIMESAMPVTFEIRQFDEWLSVKTEELPVGLVPGGRYFYSGGKIYKIPAEQQKYISIIQAGFNEAGSNEMIIPVQYQSRFISEVVPIMKKTGDVMVSPSLKKRIVQESLKTVIYLDQYNKGISAKIIFNYGDYIINPALNNGQKSDSDRFILRDIEKEQPVMDFFNQSGFTVEKELYCLKEKEDIYRFVFEKLPELQSMAEVYYSEDFKKVSVKRSISISGKVSLVDDLLEITFDTNDLDKDELLGILESLRRKKKFYRLKDGAVLPLDEYSVLRELSEFTEQMDINPADMENGVVYLPKYRALYLDSLYGEESKLQSEEEQKPFRLLERTAGFQQLIENISSTREKVHEIPKSLEHVLRDYQAVGYQWLKDLAYNGLGGILADDMGLGKTLQVLTFLLAEKENNSAPSIVIAPTSIVYNWVLEAKKFTPELKVVAISGNQAQRMPLLDRINEFDLVVTSYPLIRRDVEAYKKHRFSYCFIDEAQHVKNHYTQSARAIRKIPAGNRFALTGTPMENSLMELWSIFDFIMPTYLFSQQKFQDRFVKPIINEGDKEAARNLSRHIRPFILRRMKKDVLTELPEKIESTLTCRMTEHQRNVYMAILSQVRKEIEMSIESYGFEKSQIQILAALTRLRQICCHPSTFLEDYAGGSGKLELLNEITDSALEAGHRILLFSQFTSMLDIIEKDYIKNGIRYFYLSGKTPASERASIVSRFNNGEGQVFLLSLKAGGTGLNLTGADTVIHYDPWWNPAVEEQATDRAYRIGQENVVQVIKLITRDTIEEKILQLQEKKKEMIDMVIKPGETMLHKLTKEEIRQLFA